MLLQGNFHPDFGLVAESLIDILPKKGAGGAALCIYHNGEKVVDIWGGTRDRERSPWQEDTVAFSASTTKGVMSTLLHIVADKGLLHYDDPVSKYWPEFAQKGKERITIRQVLCHEAGLHDLQNISDNVNQMLDWNVALQLIAQAVPNEPGRHNCYHALTYGYLVGAIIEGATGKKLQQVLQDELAVPLGLDGMFIGMPDNELPRLAKLITLNGRLGAALKRYQAIPKPVGILIYYLLRLLGSDLRYFRNALIPDWVDELNLNDHKAMQAVIPSANGAFTARSLAKMYCAIAAGGEIDGVRILSSETIRKMGVVQNTKRDKVTLVPMRWRLGYHQVFTLTESTPAAFGHFGFGGSGAWCDPSRNLSMALTLNSGVGTPTGDMRVVKVSRAVVKCADRRVKWAKRDSVHSQSTATTTGAASTI